MNTLKLISETVEDVNLLVEDTNGVKSYIIEGPFLQSEIKNKNGRIYPFEIMQREVLRYIKEQIEEKRALGELGHPDSPSINLDRVSHRISELRGSGKDFYGKARILDTPNGRIVKAFIDEEVKLGVSSRGLGSLRSTANGDVVGEDFYLATAADIVADPSAPNAFVRGIMEGREWVWNNGILSERRISHLKDTLVRAPKKRSSARRLVEEQTFAKFLDAINIHVKLS